MNIPTDRRYTTSHEWLRADGTVGITEHAQAELSDIVFVELPAIGRVVKPNEAVAIIESVKAASDIYAPIAGTIVAVNDALKGDPALLNNAPHEGGWLFRIEAAADAATTSPLFDAAEYAAHIEA